MNRPLSVWLIALVLCVTIIIIGVFYYVASQKTPRGIGVTGLEEMKRRMQPPAQPYQSPNK